MGEMCYHIPDVSEPDSTNDVTNTRPLYLSIAHSLETQIVDGFYDPGDQIPTEREIAREYGVSRITARNAVKELQNKGLVVRIRGKGTFVAQPEGPKGANNRVAGGVGIISVVLPVGRHAGHDTLSSIESVARERGFHLTYHNSLFDPAHERQIIEQVVAGGSRGLLVYPCMGIQNLSTFSRLLVQGFPLAFIDRSVDCISVPTVRCRNYDGFCELTAHVIERGHRRIAFLGNHPVALPSERDRLRGFCDTLVRAGIPVRDEYVTATGEHEHEMSDPTGPERSGSGVSAIATVLERLMGLASPPTCVMALNDVTAIQLFKIARRLGLEIPRELSITGFDDLEMSAHLPVPLTTVRQSFHDLGRLAAETLYRLIDGQQVEQVITVPTRLIVRESVARVELCRAAG